QQDALLLLLQAVAQRRFELLADDETEPILGRAIVGELELRFAAIDDLDARQPSLADALGQREERVLAARRIDPTLQTRRRAAEHPDRAPGAAETLRGLARMSARPPALFICRFVLLVEEVPAEIGGGGEDRGARAAGVAFSPLARREPLV